MNVWVLCHLINNLKLKLKLKKITGDFYLSHLCANKFSQIDRFLIHDFQFMQLIGCGMCRAIPKKYEQHKV